MADLVALLEGIDPATLVVIGGQYGGYACARGISRLALEFNVNTLEGFGPHGLASPGEPSHRVTAAVLLTPSAGFVE